MFHCSRPASLWHILTGCKTSFTQGCWHHKQVLKSLASTLEENVVAIHAVLTTILSYPWTTTFVCGGAKVNRTNTTTLDRGQLYLAHDSKLLVDRELVFPSEIAKTTLRPDRVLWSPSLKKGYIFELTIPWEDAVEDAHEQKHLRNAKLAAEAQKYVWSTEVHPVEFGCRGFVATSTTILLRDSV